MRAVSGRPRRVGAPRLGVGRPLLALAVLAALGASSCSSGEPTAGTDDPAATATGAAGASPTEGSEDVRTGEEQDQQDVTVTFDGSSCVHDAPADIDSGSVLQLEAVNAGTDVVDVVVAQLLDGATFEEFLEFHQPQPKVTGPPDYAAPAGIVETQPGRTEASTFPLQGGEYALVCLQYTGEEEPAVWVAQPGGITVTG